MVARSTVEPSARTGSGRLAAWPDALIVLSILVPATFVPLAAMSGGGMLVVPNQHFYIVSAVSPPPSPSPLYRSPSTESCSCASASCLWARSSPCTA